MATITATSTNNWATAFPSVPTASDDVVIPSPYTVTVPSAYTAVCRSFTVNSGGGFTMTNTSTAKLDIGTTTAGTGNVAMSLSSGGTYNFTNGGSGAIVTFKSTSATQQTITTGGATLPTVVQNGAGSSYILGSALTVLGTFTQTAGAFDTGNYTVTDSKLDTSNSNTRSLTLGSSTWTNTINGEGWTMTSTTGLTFSSGTSTIVFTGTSASMRSNTATYYNVTFQGGGAMNLNSGGNPVTYGTLTVTGTANQTDTVFFSSNGQTINTALIVNGNSNVNRLVALSASPGSARSVTLGASATFKTGSANFDMSDVTMTGGAANERDFSAVNTVGDRGGNTGITFITGITQTRDSTNGQAWSVVARWSGGYLPLPQDTVVLGASSGNISATDVLCLGGTQNYSAYTGTLTHTTNTGVFTIWGSITLGSGMSFGSSVNTFNLDFCGRSTYTITSNGKSMFPANSNQSIQINAPTGSYSWADAFTQTVPSGLSVAMRFLAGSFDSGNFTGTIGRIVVQGTLTKSITWGTSTVNLANAASAVMISLVVAGTTWSASSATFVLSTAYNSVGSARSFDLQNFTIGTLNHAVANSTAPIQFTSSGIVNTLNVNSGKLVQQTAGTTLSVANWNVNGQSYGYIYSPGSDQYIASSPDSAALSFTGDFDLRIRMSFDNLTPSGGFRIFSKYNSASQRSWRLYNSSGALLLDMSTTGSDSSAATASQSLSAAGLVAGTTYWLRATRQQSNGNVKFYWAADSSTMPSSWTQMGTTQTATTSALFDSTAPITVATDFATTTNSTPGRYYWAQARNNILDDGTGIVWDAKFQDKPVGADSFTEGSVNAATVTMNSGSFGLWGDGRVNWISATPGTQVILNALLGYWSSSYLVIKDVRMQDPYMFFAGTTSVNAGNNLNVNFTAPPAAPLLRQSKYVNVGSTNTHTATFDYPTTAGNLLVYAATFQLNIGTFTTPPSGFTLAKDANESTNVYVKLYYKIADGTETSVSATWQNTRSNDITIYEISGWTGIPTLDVTDSNTNAGAVTSLSTGSGATNSAQPAFALALVGAQGTMGASVFATPPTNSFEEAYGTTGGRDRIAVLPLTAIGSQSTTLTWTTSRTGAASALVIFKDVSAITTSPGGLLLMGVGS